MSTAQSMTAFWSVSSFHILTLTSGSIALDSMSHCFSLHSFKETRPFLIIRCSAWTIRTWKPWKQLKVWSTLQRRLKPPILLGGRQWWLRALRASTEPLEQDLLVVSSGGAGRSLPLRHDQAVLRLDYGSLTGISPTNWNSVIANKMGKALRGRMSSG